MSPTPAPATPAGPPVAEAALTLRGFGVAYGERQVLAGLDLALPAHGVTVLLGPSGTGKSTLLRTICGHHRGNPEVHVCGDCTLAGGIDAAAAPPPLVVQKAKLLVSSVFENLVDGWPQRARLTGAEQLAHVQRWLERMDQPALVPALRTLVVELPPAQQRLVAVLRLALHEAALLLVDEPTAGLSDAHAEPVVELLRRIGRERAVLVVMHHLGQSRRLADHVLLLASGRMEEFTPAPEFFAAPRSASGRHFLRTGSCPEDTAQPQHAQAPAALEADIDRRAEPPTPTAAAPAAAPAAAAAPNRPRTRGPNGFAWLLDGRLAGTPWPGLVYPAEYDLELLRAAGVTRLLSLTGQAFDADVAARHGIAVDSAAITDMHPPTIDQALELCARLERWLAAGENVAVHCRAGLGRTGTVLAAWWIHRHGGRLDGPQALEQVRRRHGGWVQSAAQIDFLDEFARVVASQGGAAIAACASPTTTLAARSERAA